MHQWHIITHIINFTIPKNCINKLFGFLESYCEWDPTLVFVLWWSTSWRFHKEDPYLINLREEEDDLKLVPSSFDHPPLNSLSTFWDQKILDQIQEGWRLY